MKMKRKGIMICGLNGAGKSTLGKWLAERTNAEWLDNEMLYFENADSYQEPCTAKVAQERLHARLADSNVPFVYCAVDNEDPVLIDHLLGIVYVGIDHTVSQERIRQRSAARFSTRLQKDEALRKSEERFFESVKRKDPVRMEQWARKMEMAGMPVLFLDGTAPLSISQDRIETFWKKLFFVKKAEK